MSPKIKKERPVLPLFLLIILSLSTIFPQQETIRIPEDRSEPDKAEKVFLEVYNTSNSKLPNNYVTCFYADSKKNIWVGTIDGLVKISGQNWKVYHFWDDKWISCIAEQKNGLIWICTLAGVYCYDGDSFFNYDIFSSSPLHRGVISSMLIDSMGNKWFGVVGRGLVKYDDTTFTLYNSNNSGLPDNEIFTMTMDLQGVKWIGTGVGSGVVAYDDRTWTSYSTKNSSLPNDYALSSATDSMGHIWIGTHRGLAEYNGQAWNIYRTSNSGLPNESILALNADKKGNRWIGTGQGLASYDGQTWSRYRQDILGGTIRAIGIDREGNKWIGTERDGFCTIPANEVVTVHDTDLPENISLEQNYPNPFNSGTKISYSIDQGTFVNISIYDLLGKQVVNLLNEYREAGKYNIRFDADQLNSGIYFYKLTAAGKVYTRKMVLLK